MRELTVVLAYYMNPGMLARQYETFAALPESLRKYLKLIVVDDGSPKSPAFHRDIGMSVEVYRIGVDVRWNQDACRNLGVDRSTTQWLLLTDMDHLIPRPTLERIVLGKLDPELAYRFSRVTLENTGNHSPEVYSSYKPHPNSWLLTRAVYERMGGYDEALAGYYGTDADFARRLSRVVQIAMLKEVLIRVPREVIADASTTTYERKTAADAEVLPKLLKARKHVIGWQPKRLSFPWTRVH